MQVGGAFDLKKQMRGRSQLRLCFGHVATASHDTPSGVKVLEVTDTAAPALSHSEHLPAVLEQLFPHPARYRLLWYEKSGPKPLFVWRPVPPSDAFVALGMLATTTDEPPPKDAIHCAPAVWCAPSAGYKHVWNGPSVGGRAPSVWQASAQLHLMAGVSANEAEPAGCMQLATERWFANPQARRPPCAAAACARPSRARAIAPSRRVPGARWADHVPTARRLVAHDPAERAARWRAAGGLEGAG